MADEWISAAVTQLERLGGDRHYGKMRGTIIAIVGARLAGESEETVWEPRRPETCSRTIYQRKWKKQPLFADVLKQVEGLAREYQDGRSLRAKQQAAGKALAVEDKGVCSHVFTPVLIAAGACVMGVRGSFNHQ